MNARWTPEQAWSWYENQPWRCGFNYVPASAISYAEMWMEYSFDPEFIDRELALAEQVGFNCVRVLLPFVVWEAEPDAFKARLDRFAQICSRRGLSVMLGLFDDCIFGEIEDPVFARQPDVVAGWFMSAWAPSPGRKMVRDRSAWPRLESYVKDVVSSFGDDPRIWVWDLYNEPTNTPDGDATLPLLERVFDWARQISPAQPLTVGQWNDNAALNRVAADLSDITTFHDYGGAAQTAKTIERLRDLQRPMICTEWLNRGAGSSVADCLPLFRTANAGCMHWGLVNGRTQTHLNWGHRPGDPDLPRWQHDLYLGDHTPYDNEEIKIFAREIASAREQGR
jgi:hypothetical protein